MTKNLFIMGLGRSGTTALTEVVTAHESVAIGMERFKKTWSDLRQLTPDHFAENRFFDFSDDLTNLTPATPQWEKYYARLAEKYHEAEYVGDKITRADVPGVLANFPHAKVVFIVRDVAPLAHSWETRAKNPEDKGWPERNDAFAAVDSWNRALQHALTSVTFNPGHVAVVEYESFFSAQDAAPLRKLLEWLEIDFDVATRAAFDRAHRTYIEKIRSKPRPLPEGVVTAIEKVDRTRWRKLVEKAV